MRFVVIGHQSTVVIDGGTGPLTMRYPTPAGLMTDVAYALGNLHQGVETTIVWPTDPGPIFTGREAMRDLIIAHGWKTQATEGGWFTCTGPGMVHLCVAEWVNQDDPMIHGPGLDSGIAYRLRDWHARMGAHYRHTPGVAAHVSMRAVNLTKGVKWAPYRDHSALPIWEPPAAITPLSYRARNMSLLTEPLSTWDTRTAHLAALAAVELPRGPLTNTGPDPIGPGYVRWTVARTDLPWWMKTLLPAADRQGCRWTGRATAALVDGYRPIEIIDSWTAPGGRLLRKWAEQLRDYANEGEHGGPIAKRAYTEAVGLFATRTGAIQRRDWHHLVIDEANASTLRRIARVESIGLLPQVVNVDSITYAGEWSPGPWAGLNDLLGVGPNMGNLRFEGTKQ